MGTYVTISVEKSDSQRTKPVDNLYNIYLEFFVCCLILALEYLHLNSIIHRDIKPENLVLDKNGYLRLTDFGIAKIHKANNSNETSGTPGYMAPEVMCGMNHTALVDYFALGILVFEFMQGTVYSYFKYYFN